MSWVRAKNIFNDFRQAQAKGDKAKIVKSLQELDSLFTKEAPGLTIKQRKFCLAYIGEANGNGTEAARIAGYKGNELTLKAVASENLTKPYIKDALRQLQVSAENRATNKVLSATEVLVGLTRFALADPAEVFEVDGTFDLQKAQERGVSRLIKTVNFDKDTGKVTKIELYNAQQAHVDLGKYWKLFTERIEVVNPQEQARAALKAILDETGLAEDKARQIVAARFGISEQELISNEVM